VDVVKSKPGFFIVGAPKCGTTVLHHYLALHPEVFMARKEMHFFGKDLRFAHQFYRRDEAAYLREFAAGSGRACLGESSVWYLFSQSAAGEIKQFNPEARIIIMLREPVEMLHSLYHQFLFDGNEQLPSFEQALDAEPGRLAGRLLPRQNYFPQGLLYRQTMRHAEQVTRYFEVFGRDRVQVVIYDDLVADAGGVYQRTLDFLGVKSFRVESGIQVVNGNKFVKSRALRNVLNEPLLRTAALAVRPLLPRGLFSALQRAEARLQRLNTRSAGRQPLAPEFRRQLKAEFALEVAKLGSLLGRDLSNWSGERPWQRDLDAQEAAPEPTSAIVPAGAAAGS